MTEHIDNLFARQIDLLLKRVSDLEDKFDRMNSNQKLISFAGKLIIYQIVFL